MDTLNKKLLVTHINEKIAAYKKRSELAKSEGKIQEQTDYEIRMLPLNNLAIRIARGDFDHRTIKREPESEEPEELDDEKDGVGEDEC